MSSAGANYVAVITGANGDWQGKGMEWNDDC